MKFRGRVIIFADKRKYPIVAGYRPHLASKGSNNLMGIHFIDVKENVLNQYTDCIIGTSYDKLDYSSLRINEKFDVREGGCVVGEVIVLEIIE